MSESFIKDRVKFSKKGFQRRFILKAKKSLRMNGREFAEKFKISQRTLTAWTHEKVTISLISAQKYQSWHLYKYLKITPSLIGDCIFKKQEK